jgi:3-phosphoshikimate 1-carboxyvinyltransferase
MEIIPIHHPLSAIIRVPGSKSLTNRVLLIAAVAKGITRLTNALFSDDSHYFTAALQKLGFDVTLDPQRSEMTVNGLGGEIPVHKADLFIGNAGTAARFLSAFLTLGNGEYILDGDSRMQERPIGDLVSALRKLGAVVDASPDQTPPVKITASGLPGGPTTVAGDVSSQFLSALLLVAPYARQPVEIIVSTDLNSKPYVDMTIAVMRDFGVSVDRDEYRKFSIPLQEYQFRTEYRIESDASAASYFFAAPVVCGGSVRVENISTQSLQGDIHFIEILQKMGCIIHEQNNSIEIHCSGQVHGIDVDMGDISDTAQTLAAIAPFAVSPTRIRGIASARVKETDRISATCAELSHLGVKVVEHPDGLTIYPCSDFVPGNVKTYNDHRMAMAFSLIGLRIPGISIQNPDCVSKTFPRYFQTLDSLR